MDFKFKWEGRNNKMKVLIVGAGGQGAPCASILARDKDVLRNSFDIEEKGQIYGQTLL